jgi:hypothetical protein
MIVGDRRDIDRDVVLGDNLLSELAEEIVSRQEKVLLFTQFRETAVFDGQFRLAENDLYQAAVPPRPRRFGLSASARSTSAAPAL